MRSVGLVLLAVSLLLGGLAVWGLRSLGRPAAAPAAIQVAAPQTTVVVASRPIAFGEVLGPANLKTAAWPAGATPTGGFQAIAQLTTGPTRRALGPIAVDEPVLAAKVTGPGGRATLSSAIRPGLRAATVRVDDVAGVGGFVLPGDMVDVLATRGDAGAQADSGRTDIVVQAARVLAVDQTAGAAKDDPIVAKSATIEVTPAQAQKIALAAHLGTLSLSLRGVEEPLDAQGGSARTIRTGDLGGGGATPRVRHAVSRGGPSIIIYRAGAPTRVAVRSE